MNLSRNYASVTRIFFRFWLILLRLLPKRKCNAFAAQRMSEKKAISMIYAINLDRESDRWSKLKKELKRILDSAGIAILNLTERYSAVDAKQLFQDPIKDAEIDPYYTLADQLFVEPQPVVMPSLLELDTQIPMSRAEIAVARSHINIWKKIVSGNHEYTLILEDDIWFHHDFEKKLDQAWTEILSENGGKSQFDVLYVSYLEVKNGAPKAFLSKNVFKPVRGLWYLSGYILSREGAKKLLDVLPCRGPIDLWINHQFEVLDVRATKSSLISQRRDFKSSNSYSVLPVLTKIGAINSERASLYNIRPIEFPVFAFGPEGSGLSSLAMALSMLGYRCCSDFENLPKPEMERLMEGKKDRVFDAYVNIGSLNSRIKKLRDVYPRAKFIITAANDLTVNYTFGDAPNDLTGLDIAVLYMHEVNKWRVVCQHLRSAPPASSFPVLKDLGQRPILEDTSIAGQISKGKKAMQDNSPWLVEYRKWWSGIKVDPTRAGQREGKTLVKIKDGLHYLDTRYWILRSDTFTDNLALFRPSNVKFNPGTGALFSIKKEFLGVRDYSASSLCSLDQYLFGKFEATIQASNVSGVVTGIFLHRDSPRQEIDIEISGNRPDRLLINVFYNPGAEGANFDYGYRGSPHYIDLGFDASQGLHRYTIEWTPTEIRWFVDDKLVFGRVIWDPTPIPNLPMTFHVNSWLTRSTQLAGRIDNRRLPATVILREIALESNSLFTFSKYDDQQQSQQNMENFKPNQPTQ